MITAISLLLALALSARAAPSKRQYHYGDNGSFQALRTQCDALVTSDLSNVWNIKPCIFAAAAFGPIDGFLAAIYGDHGGSSAAPASVNLPRVTTSLFDSISTDGKTLSQQNFIDGYYSSLDPTSGPYPSTPDYVIGIYQDLQDWTVFCNQAIPLQNFADYYQYSSTVKSNGCATTTTTSPPSAVTTPVISTDASCQKMFTTCITQVDQKVSNPWAVEACVLGATCFGGQVPVGAFLATVYSVKNPGSSGAPSPLNVPRLSTSLFDSMSTDGHTLTQQNFIDAYYGTLSNVGGPFPPDSSQVIGDFERILDWTAFCPGTGIPYMNVADYFQYSESVQGGGAQC